MSKHRGDTIVEVLFAMVVIGISLAAAFGIANRSIQISRSSQERTEAQKIAESQIELIKAVISTEDVGGGPGNSIRARINNPSNNFCLYRDGSDEVQVDNSQRNNSECDNVTQIDSGVTYSVEIDTERESGGGNNVVEYIVTVTWDRIGTSSDELGSLTMYYRPGYIASACSSGDIVLSDYAKRNDVSGGDLNVAIRVVDVSVGSSSDPNPFINLQSDPDVVLANPLTTAAGCNYVVDYVVYCRVHANARPLDPLPQQNPAFFGIEPTECASTNISANRQNREMVNINFYESYTGNRSNAQCTPPVVARFSTTDGLINRNGTRFTDTASLTIDRYNVDATCLEFEHYCLTSSDAECSNGISNSVQMHIIEWRQI